jgi:hypothetical protein
MELVAVETRPDDDQPVGVQEQEGRCAGRGRGLVLVDRALVAVRGGGLGLELIAHGTLGEPPNLAALLRPPDRRIARRGVAGGSHLKSPDLANVSRVANGCLGDQAGPLGIAHVLACHIFGTK